MRLTAVLAISLCALTAVGCAPANHPTVAAPTAAPPVSASTPQPSTSAAMPTNSIAGAWTGEYQSTKYPSTHGTFQVTFTQSGTAINGTIAIASDCVSEGTVSGTLIGSALSFGAVKAEETGTFDGVLSGNALHGNYHGGPACGDDVGTWRATRP